MKTTAKLLLGILLIVAIGVVGTLWTPAAPPFDRDAAKKAASAYDARILRDGFGVPHIYGNRDADVAFGLGYAHMEDDTATMAEALFFSQGVLAERKGKIAAIPDYLIGAMNVGAAVQEKYSQELSPEIRAVVEGYAAGINLFCAEKRGRCPAGFAPVNGPLIIQGFAARTPFFYGLSDELTALFEKQPETHASALAARYAYLRTGPDADIGSNAMAVGPSRSADGHTRLLVNSHQPYTGPVAWYEARLKSGEGWDMIGGLFPGAPMILVGAGPELGWAHTVNKPDLFDAYRLEVDNEKSPTRYRFDGDWRDLEVRNVKFRVKLFGPFSWPVSRKAYRSVHGPVFLTDSGVYAVAYGGADEIRTAEQWYRMNKAKDYAEWRAAMEMQAIPSFNTVYADKAGNIAYFYNAAIPERDENFDWSDILPGDDKDALWGKTRAFSIVPQVINPQSGYVVNANNTPFAASAEEDNPDPDQFPAHFGIDRATTNRGFRIQELYGTDQSITADEFIDYKMDIKYSEKSTVVQTALALIEIEDQIDPALSAAIAVLKNWDRTAAPDSRGAALAVLTAQKARGYFLNDTDTVYFTDEKASRADNYAAALSSVANSLENNFGRIDPTWGEVMRFRRGDLDEPIDGGPDTLRAVWPTGDIADGPVQANGGDTYILYADWPRNATSGEEGKPVIRTIHQFGSATLDKGSPHYADQAPLFLKGEWKTPPMTLDALLREATVDKRIGGGN